MESRVLIIQTAFLGDLLLSIPLIKNAKRIYNNSEIHLLCRDGYGSFFKKLGLVDVTYEIDKKEPTSMQKVMEDLRKNEFEIILCPHESIRSAIIAFSLKAKIKAGFSKWWNAAVFNKRLKRPMHLPDALRQLSLLTLVDADMKSKFKEYEHDKTILRPNPQQKIPDWASMYVETEENDDLSVKYGITQSKLAYISAGSVWNTKRWIQERFMEVGQELHMEGYQIALIGSPDEREYSEVISRVIPSSLNLAGQPDLYELIQILKFGQVLVTNDNGAMHLGSVAGIPTVAVFGPTTLDLGYRPWNNKAVVVEDVSLKCRPCGKHGHEECPLGTHDCMKHVTSDMVINAANKINPHQ